MHSSNSNQLNAFRVNSEKIGDYYGAGSPLPSSGSARVNEILSAGGCSSQSLYEGIAEYEKNHAIKIAEYNQLAGESPHILLDPKETYLRRRFAQLLAEQSTNVKNFSGDLKTRQNDPDSATITMKELLGENGYRLYELALEEERYSTAYMDAVLNRSTREHVGEKWAERFILLVGGPSSSGKTYASSEVVKVCTPLLQKDQSAGTVKNYDISVDGGNFREMSQMRKLVIKLAIGKGYTGVQDLQEASEKTLSSAKERLQDYVLDPKNKHSVVIPETFSGVVGLDKKFFDRIHACPNTKVVFSKVTGKTKSIFQDVVKFMGSRRAWKTDWDVNISADINSAQGLPESKAYGAGGFVFGKMGTWRAKDKIGQDVIVFENDLVLKKEEPANSNNWVDAKSKDTGHIIKISERVFNLWIENNKSDNLEVFANKTRLPPIMRLSKMSEEFITVNFPSLPALNELRKARVENGGKAIEYALGRFVMKMLGDQSATAEWRADLQKVCQHLQDYQQGKMNRATLSTELQSCGNIGILLNNSKVIDKESGKVVDKQIVNAVLALNNEVKIELDNKAAKTATVTQSTPTAATSPAPASTSSTAIVMPSSAPASVMSSTAAATGALLASERTRPRARAQGTAAPRPPSPPPTTTAPTTTVPSSTASSNPMLERFVPDEHEEEKASVPKKKF